MYITKLRARLTRTAVTHVSVIGSNLTIKLAAFSPFSSAQELFKAIEEKLTINNFSCQFAPSKSDFSVLVKADNLNHALKALELFVELFSKGNFS